MKVILLPIWTVLISSSPVQRNHWNKDLSTRLWHLPFFGKDIADTGEMIFDTNSPPSNPNHESGCGVHPKKGRVLKAKFNVTCYGWENEDLPLSYQLR